MNDTPLHDDAPQEATIPTRTLSEKLAALWEKAEAATEGPWESRVETNVSYDDYWPGTGDEHKSWACWVWSLKEKVPHVVPRIDTKKVSPDRWEQVAKNYAHIAASDPTTVRALIAVAEAAEQLEKQHWMSDLEAALSHLEEVLQPYPQPKENRA